MGLAMGLLLNVTLPEKAHADIVVPGQNVYFYNGSYWRGSVVLVNFGNAQVIWQFRDGMPYLGTPTWVQMSRLRAEILCTSPAPQNGICKGDDIYGFNGNHLVGKVVMTFSDGRVETEWHSLNGNPYHYGYNYWPRSALSKKARCFGAICQGNHVTAFDGNTYKGSVSMVFENGRAEVKWVTINGYPYYGLPQYWDAMRLIKDPN